jgi:RsiW-degrading membrane proteinase PrsW (M82 family)
MEPLFLAFASLVAAIVPMFTYLLIIWWMDRNEREPFWLVFLNFIWGATGAIFLAIIGSLIFQVPLSTIVMAVADGNAEELIDLSGAIITAPVVEEATKGIFLLLMSFNKRFDGVVDGVVYGGAIGLGFGMTENFMYFLMYGTTLEDWIYVVVIRTLFSAVMHCLAQASFGAFVGYAKFKPVIFKIFLIPAGYMLAVFLHFAWNLSVSLTETTAILGFLFLIIYFLAIFAVFQVAIYLESKTILRELHDESQTGVIPAEHLEHLPYVLRRNRYGWLHRNINQKEYVRLSVELALRKHQYKNSTGARKQLYWREIENNRYKIQMMFYNAGLPVPNYTPKS